MVPGSRERQMPETGGRRVALGQTQGYIIFSRLCIDDMKLFFNFYDNILKMHYP